ncbi:MAG: hypothetical protein ACTSPS_12760 [Promethearchaeota archaeon]
MVRRPGIEPGSPSFYILREIPKSWQPGILTSLLSDTLIDRIYTSNAPILNKILLKKIIRN